MIVENKKVHIFWRKIESSYAIANRKVLVEAPRKLGSSISSVQKMLANSDEQKKYMPDIVSIAPSSNDWNKIIKAYWDSISEDIPEIGKPLEVGFIYDINSIEFADSIKVYNNSVDAKKKLSSDKDIKDYFDNKLNSVEKEFMKQVKEANLISDVRKSDEKLAEAYRIKYDSIVTIESERHKFCKPINIADYMLYRYCLVYRDVANDKDLAEKSPKIRFYLQDESSINRYKKLAQDNERNSMNLFLDLIKNKNDVEDVLYAMGLGNEIPEDDTDRFSYLNNKRTTDTAKFISIASNKNRALLGKIEKLIHKNILRRLEGSSVIVDGTDPGKIIGRNMDDAVTFFKNDENKAIISEYESRYKNLPN